MKNIFTIMIVFVATFSVYAQKPITPIKSSSTVLKRIGNDRFKVLDIFDNQDEVCIILDQYNMNLLYAVYFVYGRQFTTGINIIRYSKTKKKISSNEFIPIDLEGNSFDYEGQMKNGDTLNVFTSYKNKPKKTKYIFCTKYNLKSKKAKTIKVFECNLRDNLEFVFSKDKSKYGILATTFKGKDANMSYLIADANCNPLEYNDKLHIDELNGKQILKTMITNQGNIVLETSTRERVKGFFNADKYYNDIYLVKNNVAKKVEVDKKTFSSYLKVFEDKEKNIKVMCLTSDTKGKYDGIVLGTLDETFGNIENLVFSKFSKINFENIEGERKQRNNKSQVENMDKITRIRFSPDGNIMVLFENFSMHTVTTTTYSRNGSTTTTRTYYDYGPGVVFSFDSLNNLQNFSKLDYYNSSTIDLGAGIEFVAANNNKILIKNFDDYYKVDINNTSSQLYSGLFRKGSVKRIGMGKAYGALLTGKFASSQVLDNDLYNITLKSKRFLKVDQYSLDLD